MNTIIFETVWQPNFVTARCCNIQIAWIPRRGRDDEEMCILLAHEIKVFMASPEFFNMLPK